MSPYVIKATVKDSGKSMTIGITDFKDPLKKSTSGARLYVTGPPYDCLPTLLHGRSRRFSQLHLASVVPAPGRTRLVKFLYVGVVFISWLATCTSGMAAGTQ